MARSAVVAKRIEDLREELRKSSAHAFLFSGSDPHQSEYISPHWDLRKAFSGFTGSAGVVVISLKEAHLFTDGRYWLQAERELQGTGVSLKKTERQSFQEALEWLSINIGNDERVMVDAQCVSISMFSSLKNKLGEKVIESTIDYSVCFPDRPSPVFEPIVIMPNEVSGESRSNKLGRVISEMDAADCAYHLICNLDDIAWTLNLRGSDINFNPVFFSFLLIGKSGDHRLFVESSRLSKHSVEHLNKDGVDIKEYHSFYKEIAMLGGQRVLLSKNLVNQKVQNILSAQGAEVIERINPSTIFKSKKNIREIRGIRVAHEEDAIALIQSFMDIEECFKSGKELSEWDVARHIERNRSSSNSYRSESFSAIVGNGSNGAIIHYRPDKDIAREIDFKEPILIDCGAQYSNGTTDVTRVLLIDPSTAEDKWRKAYTVVLKAHIALAKAKFPSGTKGIQLDAFCRKELWKFNMDYAHGTGHGVGHYLNVHEGPMSISKGLNLAYKDGIVKGMVFSNEPGYYEDGAFGIRIENLVFVQEDSADGFLSLESLSLLPYEHNLIDSELLDREEKDWINDYQEKIKTRLSHLLSEEQAAWLEKKCSVL